MKKSRAEPTPRKDKDTLFEQYTRACLAWRGEDRMRRALLKRPFRVGLYLILSTFCKLFGRVVEVNAETFWGEEMSVLIPEALSSQLIVSGFYEEGLTRMVIEYLDEGAVFVDVGAHIGYYTLLASSIVGDSGQVHAFEPTPTTYKILRKNTKTKPNIVTNECALYSESTNLSFNDYGPVYSGFNSFTVTRLDKEISGKVTPKKITVKALRLDEYVKAQGIKKIDFVKIDAESAEFEILQGMEQITNIMRPIISVEVGDIGIASIRSSKDIVLHLCKRGYEAYEFSDGNIVKHNLRDSYEYDNLLFIPK